MKSKPLSKKVSRSSRNNIYAGIIVGLAVAIVGYVLIATQAAGPVANLEPEDADVSTPAQPVDDTAASGGKAIKFGPGATTPPPTTTSLIVAAAGDIAQGSGKEMETSELIFNDSSIDTVLALGDLAYGEGTTEQFNNLYDPTWGRFKDITKPTPGNHEYRTSGASGYYDYWNGIAEYYSFDQGGWHFISLNSEINHSDSSPQLDWLRNDLQANSSTQCTLAFWHTPRFTAGTHSDDASMSTFWDALYESDADVILTGHSHIYERFAPSTSSGEVDEARGIRSFVVGTGGASLGSGGRTAATREFETSSNFGILKLDMSSDSYAWQFIDVSGEVLDEGTDTCH